VGRTIGKDVFLTQQVALIGFEDMLHVNLTSLFYLCFVGQ
jgi:LacI family transcriptional regulator of maltose regulon